MGLVPGSARTADIRFRRQPGVSARVHQRAEGVYLHLCVSRHTGQCVLCQDVLPADGVQRKGRDQESLL